MRRIAVLNHVTLDGFFAGPNGEFDWPIHDNAVDKATHEIIHADTMLLGRETYSHLENFWPQAALNPNLPAETRAMANEVNQMTKLVFSTTRKEVTWENSKLLDGNLIDEVKILKQGNGADILILGSGTIVQQLANEDLIDDYVLIVNPMILGSGKSMFESVKKSPLTLVSVQCFDSGNVVMHYKRAVYTAQ